MGMTRDWRFEMYTQIIDPLGPIKYEPPELVRFIAVLPEIANRLEAVETYLTSGAKQPFVRAADRLGSEGVEQMLQAMTKRLESIEQRLTK